MNQDYNIKNMYNMLNLSSFNNLQQDYYEEDNSTPSHFRLKTYDDNDTLSIIKGISSYQNKQTDILFRQQPQREEIYEEEQNSKVQQENQENTCGNESSSIRHEQESQSSVQQKSNQSSITQITSKTSKKAKKRIDNNNNAHKYFTTQVNESCKDIGIYTKLQRFLRKNNIAFNKSSRQAFIIKLLHIRRFYPQKGDQVLKNFKGKMIKDSNEVRKNPASLYLEDLKDVYCKAIELFYKGSIIEATQCIYEIKNAKEKAYKEQGITKVKSFISEHNIDQ